MRSQFSVFFSVCVGCGCCGSQQEDANDKQGEQAPFDRLVQGVAILFQCFCFQA